tara:strand:- start:646 stop:846 length:201 start_codon:yes stop_codon:yes gene_type:complete
LEILQVFRGAVRIKVDQEIFNGLVQVVVTVLAAQRTVAGNRVQTAKSAILGHHVLSVMVVVRMEAH